jgi:hypothetical protein
VKERRSFSITRRAEMRRPGSVSNIDLRCDDSKSLNDGALRPGSAWTAGTAESRGLRLFDPDKPIRKFKG